MVLHIFTEVFKLWEGVPDIWVSCGTTLGLNRDMNRSAKNQAVPVAVGCRKLCLELYFFCAIWLNREIVTT